MRNKPMLSVRDILLDAILVNFSDIAFSKTLSAKLVGGSGMLEKLIAEDKIRSYKRSNRQNSKWDCNAADVLLHCKAVRKLGKNALRLSGDLRKTLLAFDSCQKQKQDIKSVKAIAEDLV